MNRIPMFTIVSKVTIIDNFLLLDCLGAAEQSQDYTEKFSNPIASSSSVSRDNKYSVKSLSDIWCGFFCFEKIKLRKGFVCLSDLLLKRDSTSAVPADASLLIFYLLKVMHSLIFLLIFEAKVCYLEYARVPELNQSIKGYSSLLYESRVVRKLARVSLPIASGAIRAPKRQLSFDFLTINK